jgi:hypothetical protein
MRVTKSEDGYSIWGMEPPGFERFPSDVKLMFYGWVLELGLRAKDRDLAKGLDKDGVPFKAIHEETRKHRRSAMTPSGKGDPNAPPLIPGWQKSRTRSLLTGKAFKDHVEFWWMYDSHTGDSWARILEKQVEQGRNAFGLGPVALKRVRAQAWERWDKWRAGKYEEPAERERVAPGPVRAGSYDTKYLDLMGGKAIIAKGQHAGFMTPEEWTAYFRQSAKAVLPGRPIRPKVMSPISGPRYNRGLQHDWAKPAWKPPSGGTPAPPAVNPPKPGPISRARVIPYRPAVPVGLVAQILQWIRKTAG